MARLVKMDYINDINVYKCELTDEMLELWKEDQSAFWEKYGDEVEEMFEFSHDNIGDPSEEYMIEED
jgi:hypothetical protein